MTCRLILVRHAKSSWDSAALEDHERPLNARGQSASKALGDWLGSKGYFPDIVLSSDAVRTRETWAILSSRLPSGRSVRENWSSDLYLAGPGAMFSALRATDGSDTVIMLGHNPGIAHFARGIVSTPPRHPRFADYPTGATLIVDFDISGWGDARPETGRCVDFVVPRDLPSHL